MSYVFYFNQEKLNETLQICLGSTHCLKAYHNEIFRKAYNRKAQEIWKIIIKKSVKSKYFFLNLYFLKRHIIDFQKVFEKVGFFLNLTLIFFGSETYGPSAFSRIFNQYYTFFVPLFGCETFSHLTNCRINSSKNWNSIKNTFKKFEKSFSYKWKRNPRKD